MALNGSDTDPTVLRSIRDLTGLVALPVLWAGRDGETVLQILIEAVERLMPLRFVLVDAVVLAEHPPVRKLRIDSRYADGETLGNWLTRAEDWSRYSQPEGRAFTVPTPVGETNVVRLSLGHGEFGSTIWFGSQDPAFPTSVQLALLRAAASLATTGLQTARARHESEQASRAKDEFLAMLGHELRNPLAPIVTALELIKLREDGTLPPEYRIIERQAAHLSRLVDDLLDVTRIVRGKIELRRTPVDLTTALTHAVENVGPIIKERRHTLTVDTPHHSLYVLGDPTRLVQIFTNLLTNSAKYSDPGNRIEVRATQVDDMIRVHVRDYGHGISPELLPKLFNIFEQGGAGLDRSKGGLGIGLALVKSFVELHGGTVNARSAGEGQGAEFEMYLPLLTQEQGLDARPKQADQRAAASIRTLLVDDNVDALESMATYLSLRGHVVRTCESPLDALALVREFSPQVAILDIGLPEMDGYALASELRRRFSAEQLRLIALTGYGQAKDQDQARRAGFDVHLVKPVRLDELESAMRAAVAETPRASLD